MDIDQIRDLVQLMVDHDLDRVEINEGETHILLRRGRPGAPAFAPALVPMAPAAPAPVMASPATPALDASPAASAAPAANERVIRSPMVGTFYTAPDPESSPFVKVGDVVNKDSVVCLVEAMKVFNEIKAELDGRITKILVTNGQAVEYDQPLFAVAPA